MNLSKWILEHKSHIEVIYIIASITTIITLFFTALVFYSQLSINEENNQIILENLNEEISINQHLISIIIENEEKYRSTDEFTSMRFDFFYLDRSMEIIEDKTLRTKGIAAIKLMRISNDIMNTFFDIFYPVNVEQYNLYKKLKGEALTLLLKNVEKINPLLNELKR